MIGESVGVFRPSFSADRYGNQAATYPGTATHTLTRCAFDPGGSTEVNAGRTAVTTVPVLYCPAGSDLRASDQVLIRSKRYEVDGEPAVWASPFDGHTRGVVAQLRKVEG